MLFRELSHHHAAGAVADGDIGGCRDFGDRRRCDEGNPPPTGPVAACRRWACTPTPMSCASGKRSPTAPRSSSATRRRRWRSGSRSTSATGNCSDRLRERDRALRLGRLVEDITTDLNGAALHRMQTLAWTLALGLVFVIGVITEHAMPQFDSSLLILLGIATPAMSASNTRRCSNDRRRATPEASVAMSALEGIEHVVVLMLEIAPSTACSAGSIRATRASTA